MPESSDDDKNQRLENAFSWALDHLVEDVNFGTAPILVGDPEVISVAEPVDSPLTTDLWRILDTAAGSILAVGRRGSADGPWLWVTRTSDGPLEAATLQPDLDGSSPDEASAEQVGELVLPSGRLVAGDQHSIARWGSAVAPDDGLDAQSKTGWDDPPTGRYLGLVTVVRLQPGVVCPVEILRSRGGDVHSLVVRFPQPGWVRPPTRP